VYHTRLAREDNARLVRVRYYGTRQIGPEGEQQPVFVERKTHRERWTGERSVKVGVLQGLLVWLLLVVKRQG
jgi:SPX domain protein involved in polyphosphate accumulation